MLADVDASLLYILALTSMGVYGVIIAGWATNSKYAFLGTMRSAAQIVAYEIAMGFALVGVLLAAGSINLGDIVRAQSGSLLHWFWLPLLPLFLVYFISGVAETNRAPFDVAEGESEIVAGFHVEYSGMAFAVFFLAEYANMILIAALTALMFMGGWLSPFEGTWFESWFAWVPGIFWLLAKTSFFLLLFLYNFLLIESNPWLGSYFYVLSGTILAWVILEFLVKSEKEVLLTTGYEAFALIFTWILPVAILPAIVSEQNRYVIDIFWDVCLQSIPYLLAIRLFIRRHSKTAKTVLLLFALGLSALGINLIMS